MPLSALGTGGTFEQLLTKVSESEWDGYATYGAGITEVEVDVLTGACADPIGAHAATNTCSVCIVSGWPGGRWEPACAFGALGDCVAVCRRPPGAGGGHPLRLRQVRPWFGG